MKLEEIDDEGIMAGSPIQGEGIGSETGESGDDGGDPMSKQGVFNYFFSDDSEDCDY